MVYRSEEYVRGKISSFSFEVYMNTISSSTARNYRKQIIAVIKEDYTDNKKYLSMLHKKIQQCKNNVNNNNNIKKILENINRKNNEQESIQAEDDLNFILLIMFSPLAVKDLLKIKKENISISMELEQIVFDARIQNKSFKYTINKDSKNLFKKTLNYLNDLKDEDSIFSNIKRNNDFIIELIRRQFSKNNIKLKGGSSAIKAVATEVYLTKMV